MKRFYRWLLKLYPARFREEYAGLMESEFSEEYRETQGWSRVRFSLRAMADFIATAPSEVARELWQDLRFSVRVYRHRALSTALALTALSLAIGATTGIFSVLNALLIRSLPFHEPERLVELWLPPVNIYHGRATFQAWKDASPYLADTAGYATNEMNLGSTGDSARVRVTEATGNLMNMLGTAPEFGRGFTADEEVPGRDGVAIIGYGLWQQYFGGARSALGSVIRLNGIPLTVVGVAQRGFDYPEKTAVWTPTIYDLQRIPKGGAYGWQTIGRLKPGVSLNQAMGLFDSEVQRAHPADKAAKVDGYDLNFPHLFSLRDRLVGSVRSPSLVLMAMVACVLLIACANVAHLLLSRITERRKELVVRAALGASRARLIQQLVTEATALTVAAALGGMAVAYWTAGLAASTQPGQLSAFQYTLLDWRVIAFALGLAILTGIVFGVLPVSLIGGTQLVRSGPPGSPGAGRMRAVLIAAQAALTVALAAGSFSMGRSFLKLLGTDLAFRPKQVVTLNVSLSGTRYQGESREREYYGDALERLRSVPGVESAAAVSYLPLLPKVFTAAGGFKLDSGEQGPFAVLISASPGYFRTMGTDVVEGREFTQDDRLGAEPVVVVSDEYAHSFRSRPLVGRRVDLAFAGKSPNLATIVGIVRSERYSGPSYKGGAQVFRPIAQAAPGFVTFVAKVRGNPDSYLAGCRDAVQRTDRDVPVYDVRTLDSRLADALARPRVYTTAILFFAGFALLLAVVGTYGVATHSVAQRTHEIGVRVAVGATPRSIRYMILRQSMLPVGAGLLAGVFGAAALGRFLQHLIENTEPAGIGTCALAAFLLASATAVAVWAATNRVVRMDPTAALKVS